MLLLHPQEIDSRVLADDECVSIEDIFDMDLGAPPEIRGSSPGWKTTAELAQLPTSPRRPLNSDGMGDCDSVIRSRGS